MPRRPRIQKRVILPDPIYTHEGVAKFVNVVMQRGKRSTAERVVYGSLDRIRKVAASTRPGPISALGVVAFVVLLWLMILKPF